MPALASANLAVPAPQRQLAYRVFLAVAAVYVLALAILAACGVVGFVWKSLVIPSVLLVAVVLKRFKALVLDWSVFIATVLFFDSLRGLIYSVTTHLHLPVYMGYAIAWEQALFGTPLLPVRAQSWLYSGAVTGFETFLCIIYASHFLVFLLFGLLIWIARPQAFNGYTKALLLVMGLGLLGYLLVPTVPPWMAANAYHVIPPVESIPLKVYNAHLPGAVAMFDINPIAAMPSLHCAFPLTLSFIGWHCFRLRAVPLFIYSALVIFSVVYLGQHYLVDALAGLAVAALAYTLGFRRLSSVRWLAHQCAEAGAPGFHPNPVRLHASVAGALVIARIAVSFWSLDILRPGHESLDFVARELEGKSDMVDYYRGAAALAEGQPSEAVAAYRRALGTVPRGDIGRVLVGLGHAAFVAEDYATADAAFSRMEKMPTTNAWEWAQAKLKLGQARAGVALLQRLALQVPLDHPVHELLPELQRALPPDAFVPAKAREASVAVPGAALAAPPR